MYDSVTMSSTLLKLLTKQELYHLGEAPSRRLRRPTLTTASLPLEYTLIPHLHCNFDTEYLSQYFMARTGRFIYVEIGGGRRGASVVLGGQEVVVDVLLCIY